MLLLGALSIPTFHNSVSAKISPRIIGVTSGAIGFFAGRKYNAFKHHQMIKNIDVEYNLKDAMLFNPTESIAKLKKALDAGLNEEIKHKLFFFAIKKDKAEEASLLYEHIFVAQAEPMDTYAALFYEGDAFVSVEESMDMYEVIYHATIHNSINVLSMLLKRGIHLETKSKSGMTAFLTSLEDSNLTTAQWLLDHGANINATNNDGWNGLHFAAKKDDDALAEWLYQNHIDYKAETIDGYTPFAIAIANGSLSTVQWFINHCANVDELWNIDKMDVTPLMLAAYNGHLEIVKCLVTHDASVLATTQDGKTVVDIAKLGKESESHSAVIEFLEAEVQNAKKVLTIN